MATRVVLRKFVGVHTGRALLDSVQEAQRGLIDIRATGREPPGPVDDQVQRCGADARTRVAHK
jgi:hypothetical protein